jgi:hypothetical protein
MRLLMCLLNCRALGEGYQRALAGYDGSQRCGGRARLSCFRSTWQQNFVWRAENMAERVLAVIDQHHAQFANQQI